MGETWCCDAERGDEDGGNWKGTGRVLEGGWKGAGRRLEAAGRGWKERVDGRPEGRMFAGVKMKERQN